MGFSAPFTEYLVECEISPYSKALASLCFLLMTSKNYLRYSICAMYAFKVIVYVQSENRIMIFSWPLLLLHVLINGFPLSSACLSSL